MHMTVSVPLIRFRCNNPGPTKTRHAGSRTAGTNTPYHVCTPLPQRPSAANSYYNPLAVRVHPLVPTSGVLHGGILLYVPAAPGFSIHPFSLHV